MEFIFSTPVLIRYLWLLNTVVFLHWCLILTVLLNGTAIFWIVNDNVEEATEKAEQLKMAMK